MKVSSLLSLAGVLALSVAQQTAYGQCGGINWTGPTTCVSGFHCVYSNDWYSQCVPGSDPGTPATSTTTTGGATTTTSSAPSGTTSITGYAKVATGKGVFVINGKETYFMGTNCYWCGFLTNNADVDLVMSHLASTGLKVLRVWGFNDVTSAQGSGSVWYQSFVSGSSPVINTGANGLQRLDVVVASAQAHGISLIINFVNNWTDYGGMAAYCSYYGISDVTQWYTNTQAQAQYQKYIAAVVSRYKTSTAVFAWELGNEPRCAGCDTSVITQWATKTSQYIKSLDSNHMVTIGDEGFGIAGGTDYVYTNGPGLNFTNNLAISTIDFGTFHLYPGSWGEADSWGATWIQQHAAAGTAGGKPVILEEYGATVHANEAAWQTAVLSSKTAGDMYWQYGDTLSTGQTHNDGNTIYYGTDEYNTLVTSHAAAMNAKKVT